ncbi:hypothetical protein Q2T46_11580 [Thermoanaerobacterium sp. CMT5567-10]|jgi:uncharacterized protein with von Willebrand factor type A (vWA) domain|uniref:hypothetical protein n=1 Tax=Thermoanaerobacterium sp. CMT5567-10 TaxID=3061989 RepID=UPI0026E0F2B4|nr:hypothetical protein [Thermoanaerobacterium sp. CMT5567-10]WKV08167.1 hypothetical protein Q2T46_11580 [Thermoanaerobacterium sp. CMT5567-10]
MAQALTKSVVNVDIDELDRELTTLEMQKEFRLRRIRELQELKRQAAKADALIEKFREEIAELDEEYHEKLRLYYSQM